MIVLGKWTEDMKLAVWQRGAIVFGYDPQKYRKDVAGAWMRFSDYGDRSSKFGWEIDHVVPEAKGGNDDIENLRPLQWENNLAKSDDYPFQGYKVTSDGNKNIDRY